MSSVVFAKTEIWKCGKDLHKFDTAKPDILIKHEGNWLSAKQIMPSIVIEYNNKSETLVMYQLGRVVMVADLSRRVLISFDVQPRILEFLKDRLILNHTGIYAYP